MDLRTIALVLTAAFAPTAAAAPLATPTGQVILTVSGAVTKTNSANGVDFDEAMLAALPQQKLSTSTPWHEGVVNFEGPYLKDVMKAAGASGSRVLVTALDDYSAELPFADFGDFLPILAFKRDGATMPPDDQGPLFIIYNYDSDDKLNTETFHDRSVWSVRAMLVE